MRRFRPASRTVGFIAVLVGLTLATSIWRWSPSPALAAAGINKAVNFQGKLTNSNGTNITNGTYNMRFRLYDASSAGTLIWTEDRLVVNTQGVAVTDGIFQVNLGEICTLAGSTCVGNVNSAVNFNTDNLYLTIALGNTSNVANFASASPDPEMSPRIRFTAAPYAMNSDNLQGIAATGFVQLGQGATQSVSTATSAISVNQTSSGNLLDLQSAGTAAFDITSVGNQVFGQNADHTITVTTNAANAAGKALTISAGQGGAGAGANAGGALTLQGGAGGGTNGAGGSIVLTPGAKNGTGAAGTVVIKPAASNDSTTFFLLQSAGAADTLLTADTSANKLVIGNATGTNTATTLLVLDSATADPATGFNGAQFYNSTTNKFRCYQNGAWTDCIGAGGSTTLQNVYDNSTSPATILTSSSTKSVIVKAGVGFDQTALLQVQKDGGTPVFTVDTTNSQTISRGINSIASIGADLRTGNCTGTNWSGTGAGPYTHSSGVGVTLTCTITGGVTAGATYEVNYDTTGMGVGDISVVMGGSNGSFSPAGNVTSFTTHITTNTTANPTFTIAPSTSTGAVTNISFKLVTVSNPVLTVQNSDGSSGIEVRAGGSTLFNTFIGVLSGQANTTGNSNTAFGAEALKQNTTGLNLTAVGGQALLNNTTGINNTAVGIGALAMNNVGSENVGIGLDALFYNTTGIGNVGLGNGAAQLNESGSGNTGIGTGALEHIIAGNNNSALGTAAGGQDTDLFVSTDTSNSTAIGANSVIQGSNVLVLGGAGTDAVNVGIGTTIPTNTFSVSPTQYNGVASGFTASQTTTTVTGTGTTFTAAMVGSEIIWQDGSKASITGFTDATHLTVTPSQSVTSQGFRIHYAGLQVTNTGDVGIGVTASTARLSVVQNGTSDGANLTLANLSGTQTNGLLIARNGAGGTTTNLLSLQNTAGTATNGILFTGTIGTDINTAAGSGAGAGRTLVVRAGAGGSTGTGGAVTITGGTGGATSGTGGAVTVSGGSGGGNGPGGVLTLQGGAAAGANSQGGNVVIAGGTATGAGAAATVTITSGAAAGGGVHGGALTINSGAGNGVGPGGTLTVQSGAGGATANGGDLTLKAGAGGATSGTGGATTITGGNATAGVSNGGNLTLSGGAKSTSGTSGSVIITPQAANDSTTALLIQSASAADTLFTADTTANKLVVGNATGTDTATTILQLDGATANPTTNLAALNGGMFYNSTTNKVSIIENGSVKVVCNETDLACGAGGGGGDNVQVNGSAATDANFLDTTATGSVAGTTFTLNAGPAPDTVTVTVSNASATVAGVVTTGAQTFAGDKTFTGTLLQKSDSATAFNLQDSTGTYNNLLFDSSTNHLKVFDHTAPRTAYADIYYSGGVAVFAASTGTTQLGTGTGGGGDINLYLTGAPDVLNANKTYTAAAAYSVSDFNITRNITGSTFALTGNVAKIEDLSTFTSGSSAPNVLVVNQNNTSATGNLIVAQTGGSTTKFAVSTTGVVSIASGGSITGLGAMTVAAGAGTGLTVSGGSSGALTLTGNAASTWSTSAGNLTIQAGGASKVIAKPGTDSTSSFEFQNAAGTAQLVVDTTNSALKVGGGDVSPGTTPTVFVLDHKSTAGDPATAVNGAMYYNAGTHQYRCYRDSYWEPCGINPLDRGFKIEDEFMSGAVSATTATPGFGEASWTGNTVGATACAAYTYNNATPAPTSDRPGIIRMATGAAASTGCSLIKSTITGGAMVLAAGNVMKMAGAVGSIANPSQTFRIGATSQSTVVTAPTTGLWWEADPLASAFWRYCYGTGAAATCAASSNTIAANTFARLEIRLTAVGAGVSAATFIIDGVTYTVSGVTIGTATRVSPSIVCTNDAGMAVSKNCFIDYYQIRGVASAAR